MLGILTVLIATAAPPTPSDTARTMNGVTMPETITVDGTDLVLNGMATRKKAIFKVYVAGLYLAERSSNAEAILSADSPRRIVLHFLRGVDKGKMCGAWEEGLRNNTSNPSAELTAQFATLCSYMDDVKDEEEMVFTYKPGQGTVIEVRGAEKGTIETKEFADALFRSWLGPKPGPGDGVKKKLLGLED